MENLIKMDDLGSSPISGNLHVSNIYRYLILTLKKIEEDRVDTSYMEHVVDTSYMEHAYNPRFGNPKKGSKRDLGHDGPTVDASRWSFRSPGWQLGSACITIPGGFYFSMR